MIKYNKVQQIAIPRMMQMDRMNLFMGMGCGKTLSTLTYLEAKNFLHEDVYPAVVFAPLSVAQTVWHTAIEQFYPHLRYSIVTGTASRRKKAMEVEADVYVVNYDNATWFVDTYLHGTTAIRSIRTVICDECTRLKGTSLQGSPVSNTFKDYNKVRGGVKSANAIVYMAQYVRYWINLSGTPTPNGAKDLWGIQLPIDFGVALGSKRGEFNSRYCTYKYPTHPEWGVELSAGMQEAVLNAIKDTTISIKAEHVYGKDEPIKEVIPCYLTEEYKKEYKALKQQVIGTILKLLGDDGLNKVTSVGIAMKLRQYASGCIITNEEDDDGVKQTKRIHTIKTEALLNYCEEYSDENIIIAYHYRNEAQHIYEALKERFGDETPVEILTGSKDRDAIVKRWNDGKIKYLILHPQSAGHGLNLQHGGRRLIFYTMDYRIETYSQVCERIGVRRQRQSGYDRAVYISHILMKDTIDETIYKVCVEKTNAIAEVLSYLQIR